MTKRIHTSRVDREGRVVIPTELRIEFNLVEGEEVLLRVKGGTIQISSLNCVIARVQEQIAQYREFGRGVLKEFIREQEEQAEWEQQELEIWYGEYTATKGSGS